MDNHPFLTRSQAVAPIFSIHSKLSFACKAKDVRLTHSAYDTQNLTLNVHGATGWRLNQLAIRVSYSQMNVFTYTELRQNYYKKTEKIILQDIFWRKACNDVLILSEE